MALQDAPVAVANYYSGDTLRFGLFDSLGLPHTAFFAFKAFGVLLQTPRHVETGGSDMDDGLALCAGLAEDGQSATVLVSNFRSPKTHVDIALSHLPWTGRTHCEFRRIDADHRLDLTRSEVLTGADVVLRESLPAPSVCLITLRHKA